MYIYMYMYIYVYVYIHTCMINKPILVRVNNRLDFSLDVGKLQISVLQIITTSLTDRICLTQRHGTQTYGNGTEANKYVPGK